MQNEAKASHSTKNAKKITDFPLELLLDIYEGVDLNTLANVAKTHPNNWGAAAYVFNKSFAIQTFDVNGISVFNGMWKDNSNNEHEFNTTLNALEMFGHLMTKIKLNYYYYNKEQIKIVNRYLNEYVSNSLIEMELSGCRDGKYMTGSFKKVEILHLYFGNVTELKLNEIFPAVRVLDLKSMQVTSKIDYQLPHMIEMHCECEFVYQDSNATELERRLRLNPQVRRLWIMSANINTLKMISEIVPQLEHLELKGVHEHLDLQGVHGDPQILDKDIQFPNIKNFTIPSSVQRSIERVPIAFENLEEVSFSSEINSFFHIISHNEKLKKITSEHIYYDKWQRIAAEVRNLEEFVTGARVAVENDVNRVVSFIETCKNLKTMRFLTAPSSRCEEILGRLQPDWELVRENTTFYFTRD